MEFHNVKLVTKGLTEIEANRVQEIIQLHNQLGSYLRLGLSNAIRIGQLLTEQKDNLSYGEFTPWVRDNLPFTDRTARNYMRVYRERDRLRTENVSVLTEGYKLLTGGQDRDIELPGDLMELKSRALELESRELELQLEFLEIRDVDIDRASLRELVEIQKRCLKIQNGYAEIRIRAEREVGRILAWFESECPEIYVFLMANAERGLTLKAIDTLIGLCLERVRALETGGSANSQRAPIHQQGITEANQWKK